MSLRPSDPDKIERLRHDWVEVGIMVERAYRQVAPKRLLRDQPGQV